MFIMTGTNLAESCDDQNMTTRIVDAVAPPEICVHIGQVPQCSELDAVPFPAVKVLGKHCPTQRS